LRTAGEKRIDASRNSTGTRPKHDAAAPNARRYPRTVTRPRRPLRRFTPEVAEAVERHLTSAARGVGGNRANAMASIAIGRRSETRNLGGRPRTSPSSLQAPRRTGEDGVGHEHGAVETKGPPSDDAISVSASAARSAASAAPSCLRRQPCQNGLAGAMGAWFEFDVFRNGFSSWPRSESHRPINTATPEEGVGMSSDARHSTTITQTDRTASKQANLIVAQPTTRADLNVHQARGSKLISGQEVGQDC